MNKLSKILWLACGSLLVPFLAVRFILGYWHPFLLYITAFPILCFIAAIAVDHKFYIDLFASRGTKHGLNMGMMILLVLILIITLNTVTLIFKGLETKTWDLTEEKLHTLSSQSRKILKNLKDSLKMMIFYPGDQEIIRELALKWKSQLRQYSEADSRVEIKIVNAHLDPKLAADYFSNEIQKSHTGVALFVEYQGRRVRVEIPSQNFEKWEENVTNAIIKVSRTNKKVVYFLKGHGEKDEGESSSFSNRRQFRAGSPTDNSKGIKNFKKALEDSSFVVKNLNLIESGEIPSDMHALMMVGPLSPLFESEWKHLKNYMSQGGRFFIAADPRRRHNISSFLKLMGVDFKDNIVQNDIYKILGWNNFSVLGMSFSSQSPITKDLSQSRARQLFFNVVSEVAPLKEQGIKKKNFKFVELVKSHSSSYVLDSLPKEGQNNQKPSTKHKRPKRRAYTLALSVEGTVSAKDSSSSKNDKNKDKQKKETKTFKAVVFGDSDFLTDHHFSIPSSRNLALNSISYLLGETDLVSIRPKQINRAPFKMTSMQFNIVVVGGVFLPVVLLWLSALFWFRRIIA